MSPVINRNNYSNQRNSYLRFISTALISLQNGKIANDAFKDICVFIFLTLLEIQKSVRNTIQPWEKRGYWVKADQFRDEWKWVDPILNSIEKKIKSQDWKALSKDIETMKEICKDFPPYQRLQVKNPWEGSWKKWERMKKEAGS
ncbi:MAG: hypothetical protein C4545_07620 [Anaerolineaceae bacterium]|jgi:hypothetical protein|nr:MAG: hypothetical protein C4545_07620 [Anaerolineaceae bacterium]